MLNKKEKILVSRLLEMASERFSNHGCNDLGDDFWESVSEEEQAELYRQYHEWNGDPEEFDSEQIGYLGDSTFMSFFSEKILEEEKNENLSDDYILRLNGWEVECESPFEIRHTDGSFATEQSARIVLESLKEGKENGNQDRD